MANKVEIDSVEVTIALNSLRVEQRIEARSLASFAVIDLAGSASYQRGQPVQIWDPDVTLIFGGAVSTSKMARLVGGGILHTIRCADYHYLADKRLAAESYISQTAGFIVDDIYDKYLAPEGVGIGSIQAGPTIVEAVIDYQRVSDAYDALAEKAGFIWYIDEAKDLYFIDRATNAAPWTATNLTMARGSIPTLTAGNPKYRNRQFIRGGRATTDEQTEDRVGDGTTVSFALGFPLEREPSIKEGDPLVAKTVGIKGLEIAKDWYWSKGDPVVTAEVAPEAAEDIEFKYYGQYDILALVEDPVAIAAQQVVEGGGTGIVDDIAEETTLNEKNAVFDSGIAKLARFAVTGKRFNYRTNDSGLMPGQIQTVNYPLLGLVNVEMLIESVTASAVGAFLTYDIIAIQGPEEGGWSDLFKSLAAAIGQMRIGEGRILSLLLATPEIWDWTEAVLETVYACPIPSVTLYPSASLYPC